MSDDVQYVDKWEDESTQCKNCKLYQSQDGKNACVPENKSFEYALKEYGEVNPQGHCNCFETK